MHKSRIFAAALLAVAFINATAQGVPHIANIINFVRKTEPRFETITDEILYQTTENQKNNLVANRLHGTFLLQYDALIDPQYQKLMKSLPSNFEVGAWWEITQPHVEAAGIEWRGRYPWDWHANVGFSTGYTPQEREKLVDTYMQKFKEIFGKYPASVGSWFIDAHTLKYFVDKYHITASCNCRDQIGTDGYTLWGGYWHGAYYPSVNNAYIPAQSKSSQINVPVFRMLGSDPLYQYECGVGGVMQGVSTLEPTCKAGASADWVDWYLKTVTEDPAMGYTYFQAGQENSFTWAAFSKGFEMQMAKIAELQRKGIIRVETLEESGRNFAKKYKTTPATAVSAMSDYTPRNAKTLWFNSRYYRANLFWENNKFRFRDIQMFNEDNKSLYLTTPGTSTECHYFALPLVDGCLWSVTSNMAGLRLYEQLTPGKFIEASVTGQEVSTKGKNTIVEITTHSGNEYTITLSEKTIGIVSKHDSPYCLQLTIAPEAKLPFTTIGGNTVKASHNGFAYSATLKSGEFTDLRNEKGKVFKITPRKGRIVLHLAQK
jgi:hypothetical protein